MIEAALDTECVHALFCIGQLPAETGGAHGRQGNGRIVTPNVLEKLCGVRVGACVVCAQMPYRKSAIER